MPHQLGKILYRNGEQLQIIGEPYQLFDRWYQDARDEHGQIFAVATPEQEAYECDLLRRQTV